ncbi:rRNA-processing protein FYV7 isoform X2 [Eucalyptus grandis]|uniref:rRNA-processing protein FYV7 isoform X2 n=1 Tax=Eucalyptus grandis TaxID=71139 RepID=UPI00192EA785|nr:rRNA-processing protein FYV7 isoform X2 [Eucalyptus grandis]
MKGRAGKDGEPRGKGGRFFGGSSKPAGSSNKAAAMKKKKQNVTRLGGGGLSLEAFANIKSTTNRNQYNPALIKKKREFYKNAKYISKYKKSLKHLSEPNDPSAVKPSEEMDKSKKRNKNEKRGSNSLRELYEKKREEEEIARKEREVVAQAKKEEREKAEARRKAERVKMFKKTRSGQPVMKYRIEHLLQSMQGSN